MKISLSEVAQYLAQADTLVLSGHIHPDGDCLGSMLALYAGLTSCGKQVELLLDDDVPAMYGFLPGIDLIRRPQREARPADLFVVLDASDAERLAGVRTTVKAPILNIDHHISNTGFADYWYVDSQAAATGEIILQLLGLLNASITRETAVCLYTAIATDCGFFRYANTTSATLRYAADLIDFGVEPHLISEQLETKPLASITTLTRVLQTLEIHHNGKLAAITIPDDIAGKDADNNTEGFINYPRNIAGVEIAVMFCPVDATATRTSFRSHSVDVSRLALAFGGGGHALAAGCTASGGLAVAKAQVLAAAEKLLTEVGQ